MPELPEVQTIVTALRQACQGAVIREVIVDRPDIVRGGASQMMPSSLHQRIENVGRQGKRIVIDLAMGGRLVFHLGMSGRLTLESPTVPLMGHTHLRIRFEGLARELRFRDPRRFGGVWFFRDRLHEGSGALSVL